jgi:hypothetical protein
MEIVTKNEIEEVRIARKEWQGNSYIDVRLFCQYDGVDEPRPTRKGLTLSPELWGKILPLVTTEMESG